MRSIRISISVALAVAVLSVGLITPVAAQPGATAVTDWNRIAVSTLLAFPPRAGSPPPAIQLHLAMVQGAVYDAVNAVEPKHHRPYLLNRRFSSKSSREAAVATAAWNGRPAASACAAPPTAVAAPAALPTPA